ncbi:hypothetical protein ANCDUO_05431, partial [Ancylostoma duodenale]
FRKLVTYQRSNGSYQIDYNLFNSTYAVKTPHCSAMEHYAQDCSVRSPSNNPTNDRCPMSIRVLIAEPHNSTIVRQPFNADLVPFGELSNEKQFVHPSQYCSVGSRGGVFGSRIANE